jgi:hypothetical protein
MKLEILYQFIVPLTFLAIWALTSLLNRDAQPLPPRASRGPGGDLRPLGAGPRVEQAGAARYLGAQDRVSSATTERESSARWTEAPPLARPRPPRAASDEGITILDLEARTARASSASAAAAAVQGSAKAVRAASPRRGARARSAQAAAAAKPIEQRPPRALTSLVIQSLAQKKARPLAVPPLAAPLSPLAAPLTETVSTPVAAPPTPQSSPVAYSAGDLRALLAVPAKLREIAVLSELLQPPRARRPWRTSL